LSVLRSAAHCRPRSGGYRVVPVSGAGRRSAWRDLRGGVPQCQRRPPHRWPRASRSLPAAPL